MCDYLNVHFQGQTVAHFVGTGGFLFICSNGHKNVHKMPIKEAPQSCITKPYSIN